MNKNFTTREMLDSIIDATRTYRTKIERVNAKVAKNNFSRETKFMREVSANQSERETFLAGKRQETETLRQSVKRKKLATEQTIDKFKEELR